MAVILKYEADYCASNRTTSFMIFMLFGSTMLREKGSVKTDIRLDWSHFLILYLLHTTL